MTKYLNKFLIISILSVISLNAFSSIGSFVPALANALKVASQSPSVQALAESAWGGVSGAVAVALDAGGFFSGGSIPVSEGSFSSGTVDPSQPDYMDVTNQPGYLGSSGGTNLGDAYWSVRIRPFSSDCYAYGGQSPDQEQGSYALQDGQSATRVQIGSYYIYFNTTYTCSLTSQVADFSNPTLKPVNLSEDAEGKFYMNPDGVRVPVYPMTMGEAEAGYLEETGQNYDFGSGLWDSTDTGGIGPEYKGLDYEDATKRANFLKDGAVIGDPGFDSEFIVHNDFLPELADWDVSHYQEIAGNDSEVIVHNFDSDGNYVDTTIDTYANLEIVQDGVTVDQTSTFSDRQTITDPALVGTVSDPGVTQVQDPSSTYTGSDGLSNSGTSENTLAINESSSKTDGILNKILGQLSTATKATAAELATATNTGGLLDFFAGDSTVIPDVPDPTSDFLASVPTDLQSKTDFQNQLDANGVNFDFDENTYHVDIFGTVKTCPPRELTLFGKTHYLQMDNFCTVLNFIGLLMLAFSYYIAFLIVFGGRK